MEQALGHFDDRLPEPVAYLITKATFPKPDQRYPDVGKLARVLEGAMVRLPPIPARCAPLYEPVLEASQSQVTGPTIVFED